MVIKYFILILTKQQKIYFKTFIICLANILVGMSFGKKHF